ncbi:MAG: hypothetical protein U5J97_01730 [Trueperaceae bacterium]|nr:hypothetical protein [Trueperaceae bacterium]
MRHGWTVEQLIVGAKAGRASILVVLEAPSGARRRERFEASSSSTLGAVNELARHLAYRADVDGAQSRLRVREERSGGLVERTDLARAFAAALDLAGDED